MPLLDATLHRRIAAHRGALDCSLDLGRTISRIEVNERGWQLDGTDYPFMDRCRDHTLYHWTGEAFEPVARFGQSLIKLVPTTWGPPTFEIDGIKMLPSSKLSPWEDARQKVMRIEPRGKRILDTCGGLGYFAAWCAAEGAREITSFEKNADVLWLRQINPWSPSIAPPLNLTHADVSEAITTLPDQSVDAILHDPPRFGIAGELYSLAFYRELARVIRRNGTLFHYVGTPNALTSGRNVPAEVGRRLKEAGFDVQPAGDGLLGRRR